MSQPTPSNQPMDIQVVLERDAESKHYTATVPGLPIVVDATSRREALRLAREAVALYVEETQSDLPTITAEVVSIKV
jgi:predicted RNase H-like HicB family nuclease